MPEKDKNISAEEDVYYCPVILKMSRRGGKKAGFREVFCKEKVPKDKLEKHMHKAHEIVSPALIQFYLKRARFNAIHN